MISVANIKLRVIEAALGIATLDEPELFRRLERLYLDGIAEGIKAAQNLPASAQTQGTEHA